MNKKKLPVYNASVDEEGTGIYVISLVDFPAVEVGWQLFNSVQETFKIENEEKREILGVVMLAETPIYRRDPEMGEYYIKYTRETIEKMVQKFFKDGYQENVDQNHSFELIKGIELQQAFIKDTEKGISPVGFEKVPDGSLFFVYKVVDDALWDEVKNGSWTGFSLAGAFNLVEMSKETEEISDEDFDEIMGYIDRLNKIIH